jgi:hypothetical protein
MSPTPAKTPANPEPATVRELIVQLAQVEDALRHTDAGGLGAAALAAQEQDIVDALHRHGLPFHAQGAERP